MQKFFLFFRLGLGEPLAYILGYKEWYGRRFLVNHATLIPRHETELIIELLSASFRENRGIPHTTRHCEEQLPVATSQSPENQIMIIDVGTGSGCIAITAKLEFPSATVIATDISDSALRVARKNAQLLNANVEFKKGNLLELLDSSIRWNDTTKINYIFITANLPYIPTQEYLTLPDSIKKFEPRTALEGGDDGLKYYRILFSQLTSFPHSIPFTLYCEIMPDQEISMRALAQKVFPNHTITFHKDLAGMTRIAEIKSSQP